MCSIFVANCFIKSSVGVRYIEVITFLKKLVSKDSTMKGKFFKEFDDYLNWEIYFVEEGVEYVIIFLCLTF